MSKWVEAVA